MSDAVSRKKVRNGSRMVSIRLDHDLLRKAHAEAKRQRRTLSNFIRCTIEDALKARS